MALWIEVKVRYDKLMDNGTTKKVTEVYLVDALSCTEAEARVIEELTPFTSGDLSVTSASKTKISEVFLQYSGDRYYKVKVNFITIDEKTVSEKRTASYIIVPADGFAEALHNFNEGMKGTLADYEIEAITETKLVDVFKVKFSSDTDEKVEKIIRSPNVRRHAKAFVETCAYGGVESVTMIASDGKTVHSATLDIPPKENKPKPNDNG